MATCQLCSKEFVKASGVQKYCSADCRNAVIARDRKGPSRQVSCKGCETVFETTNGLVEYCGSKCRVKHLNAQRPTTQLDVRSCVVCGNAFQPMQKRGKGRSWCSEECKHIMGGNPVRLAKMASGEADSEKLKAASLARRKWAIKNAFGITLEQYEEMFVAQGGVCKICKRPEFAKNGWNSKTRALAVDHCHVSGKIRGLLCTNCNRMLGLADDRVAVLETAIEYLKEHSDGLEKANDG